jgi:ATP-dependent RNA helicase RhlE
MPFDSLGLPDYLLRALAALSYEAPTNIQEQAIPLALAGHDLLAEAQTGTGKTAAFALPIIMQLNEGPARKPDNGISALVVVPTRELAGQVASAFQSYSRYAPRKVTTITLIGGESVAEQLRCLRDGASVVVATPGRLLDIIERDGIDLAALDTLVLDEADKLLDLGFSEELQTLLGVLPEGRQNLLFSATLAPKIVELSDRFLKDPVRVSIAREEVTLRIVQRVIEVDRDRRRPLLQHLIAEEAWPQVLVFVASKRSAHNLANKLRGVGIEAAALHGDLEQSERTDVLRQFKNKKQQVLVATDLVCRGIDISGLSCVVNYDLPRSPNDYVHRIGRTGRAGKSGVAVSFIDHETQDHFRLIEKRANVSVKREQVDGFTLSPPTLKTEVDKGPIKGKRKSKKDRLREQAARLAASATKTGSKV